MHTLLNFLIKHNHWFLFLLLEGIGIMLIVQFNSYQNATFFTSANNVSGNIFAAMSDVNGYFSLRSSNEELHSRNTELCDRISILEEKLAQYEDSAAIAAMDKKGKGAFFYNAAKVVNNSFNAVNNYITIDKGTTDGIEPEMGVFGNDGVIGIVYTVSNNFAVVIPLLNSKSNISCRIKGSDSFATLQWDGKDTRYSYLVDLPRYTQLLQGDTVVTSGHSSIFPGDIPVGTVEKTIDSEDGMFYCAQVKLFTDFTSLTHIYVVGNKERAEQKELELSTYGK